LFQGYAIERGWLGTNWKRNRGRSSAKATLKPLFSRAMLHRQSVFSLRAILRECCLSESGIKDLRLDVLAISTSQLSRAEEHIELVNRSVLPTTRSHSFLTLPINRYYCWHTSTTNTSRNLRGWTIIQASAVSSSSVQVQLRT
jgi:tRNA splicing ligase